MKKFIAVYVAFVLVAATLTPGLAHGSRHGRKQAQSVKYTVCGIEDCELVGLHAHDGSYYYAHYYNDGHNYHGYCDIADCDLSGYHAHDGTYCFAHSANDGHVNHKSARNGRHC